MKKEKKKLSKEMYVIIFFAIIILVIGVIKLLTLTNNNNPISEPSSEASSDSSTEQQSSEQISTEEPDTRIDWDEYARGKSQKLESNGIKGYTFVGEENLKGFPSEVIEYFKKNLKDYWKEADVVVEFVSGTRNLNELGTYTVIIYFNAKDEYNRVDEFKYISDDDGKETYYINYK